MKRTKKKDGLRGGKVQQMRRKETPARSKIEADPDRREERAIPGVIQSDLDEWKSGGERDIEENSSADRGGKG